MKHSTFKAGASLAIALALGATLLPPIAHADENPTTHWVLAADESKVLKKHEDEAHPDNDNISDIPSYVLVEVKKEGNRIVNTYKPETTRKRFSFLRMSLVG